ncbi:MAG: PepSY-associated TM helix domain-containing protein [Pseudomonadota bacterium]
MRSRQQWYNLARTVHLYSSTVLFSLLVFFGITGFTLSHGWYADDQSRADSIEFELPLDLSAGLAPDNWQPRIDELSALIAVRSGLGLPDRVELDQEYGEITLSYKAPAGDAQAIVSSDGVLLDRQQGSWLAVLNDLHKNRDAGSAWSLLVDVCALGILVFGLTGVIIVFQNRRRRTRSVAVIAVGLITPLLLYFAFVPRIVVPG